MKLFEPIVEYLKLQVRFNLKSRNVEIRTCKDTEDIQNLLRPSFHSRFALVRLDDLFVDSFEKTDVKMIKGRIPSGSRPPPILAKSSNFSGGKQNPRLAQK